MLGVIYGYHISAGWDLEAQLTTLSPTTRLGVDCFILKTEGAAEYQGGFI